MKTSNYHNEEAQFEVGQTVTHVTDTGATVAGTITGIDGDSLHIEFSDGEEGWEKASTCF